MAKQIWRIIKASPAILGASFLVATNPVAAETVVAQTGQNNDAEIIEQISEYNQTENSMEQVTSVSEFRDVDPTGWAFEALRSLVERYGCIEGFPSGVYLGNQAMTRYEFAAGLNACLNQMERLIAASEAVLREDMEKLQRLTQEFEAELAAIGARVDNLEGRVAFLEDHQFSTTTKLNGEVIFNVSNAFGDEDNNDSQATFGDRVRLNFDTSFTGKDRLRIRLQAGSMPRYDDVTGTEMARLGFDTSNGNDIVLDDLYYRFPIGEKITTWIGTNGTDLDDIFSVTNPYLESSGTGALSRFIRYNPLVYRSVEGSGAGLKYEFSEQFAVSALYLADSETASDPGERNGIFNGAYSTGLQVDFSPMETLDLAFTFLHSYQTGNEVNLTGSTGSDIGKKPFGDVATTAQRFGLQASWLITPKINFAAWGGYANAEAQAGSREGDSADLWTWSANFSFIDLGKEGAVASIAGGMPPKATSVDGGEKDPNTSYIIEVQYKYPLTDNILITPGVYLILNPDHDDNRDTIYIGAIRTTFKF
ncbi:MAG: iron uptake porin [Gomphosphaeria aponina SAG 52.96 = DSM 107014]|uniref:Iron uptake porin n=1 Tax=Gomphosphaeria aponina SAG 52.96 = DSM 107014 TaxID=1521640 RepID=A0A941JLB6_9CHRO|nr:iron uptake porin [Gomphosphaeria aponina SAG 52.96 = DSM 107014]